MTQLMVLFSLNSKHTQVLEPLLSERKHCPFKNNQQRQFNDTTKAGNRWQDYDLIFPSTIGTPFNPRNLFRQYKILLQEAGLPAIRFHDLRHTTASQMFNHGIPVLIVSKRLGHAKPSITLDIYGNLNQSMQEQAAQIMDEVITPTKLETVAQLCTRKLKNNLK